jgi:hypothetical protein
LEEYMQDESSTPQEEEEVEGHMKPGDPDESGRHFERDESEEDEVEGHIRPRHGPEEPERHF